MRIKFLVLTFLVLMASPSYAQKTKATLQSEINLSFPNNNTGEITPATVRGVFSDFVNSWQQYTSVNTQAGTTYSFQASDYGQLVSFTNAGSIAGTLPTPAGSFLPFNTYVTNSGTGTLTLSATGGTIKGASTLFVGPGSTYWLIADGSGTNYLAFSFSIGNAPPASSIQVGNTTVTGGNNNYILYNQGGILGNEQFVPLAQGGLGGSQAAATVGQIPIYPGSFGAAVPGGLASIVGTATAAQIAGSAASHAVPVDVGGTPTWKVIGDCQDSGGNHLNYTQSTDAFSCGTSGGSGAPGFYTLQYVSSAWGCTDPAGSVVSIAGTTTSGLQECLNAMNTGKLGNFRAICPDPASGVYIAASTTITFGPSAGVSYDMRGCRLVSTATSIAVLLETLEFGTHLDWSAGQIECGGSATCVKFNPSTADPLFGSYGISWGYIDLPTVMTSGCASNGGQAEAIDFDSNGGVAGSHVAAIYAEHINIGAIDGFDGTHNCFYDGIKSINPTNAYAAFGQNFIYVGYIQGFSNTAIQNGTSILTQATQALATNEWNIGTIGSGGTVTAGVATYGFLDRWNVNISVNSGTLTIGFDFAATTANGNWINAPQLGGTTPLVDSGTTVKNYGFYNGGGYKTGGTF